MSYYEPLYDHLSSQTAKAVCMSYGEIEQLLGRKLPPTARGDHARQWWANTDSHVQAKSWLNAHRRAKLDIAREQVTFHRVDAGGPTPAGPLASAPYPNHFNISRRALHPAAIRLIEDMAEENRVDLPEAAAQILNQTALRRRRETLDWFAQNTASSSQSSAALIRADRDAR